MGNVTTALEGQVNDTTDQKRIDAEFLLTGFINSLLEEQNEAEQTEKGSSS